VAVLIARKDDKMFMTRSLNRHCVQLNALFCCLWRNVKPQRCAKDNRKARLTARSDKSVAHVTNNKTLYSTFYTVEANY